jgi:hypothetical protein
MEEGCMKESKVGQYWWSNDDEYYHNGPFDTLEECVADIKENKDEANEEVFIGFTEEVFGVYAGDILDYINDKAAEFYPENVAIFKDGFEEKLQELINDNVTAEITARVSATGVYSVVKDNWVRKY